MIEILIGILSGIISGTGMGGHQSAGFGGGEGVESEERVISRQIFTIEANTFQIARIVREIEEVITD